MVRGNPLQDIRRTRLPRVVIKAGRVYDPAALMKSVEGKIGPASAADSAAWAPTPRADEGTSLTAPHRLPRDDSYCSSVHCVTST